jgi:AcrR family transcriptional regulator
MYLSPLESPLVPRTPKKSPAPEAQPQPESKFQRDPGVEDRIIDATVKCFQRFGINKTSMEDIAKVAKVSRPTIYRYFPSRHHLAVEVLIREVRDHTRLVVPLFEEYAYPPTAMVEGIVFAVSAAREHPYTSIVVTDAGTELLSRVGGADTAMLSAMSEMWLPSLTKWREKGYLRKEVKLEDLLLWITFYMHSTLGKGFVAMTPDRMRRMLRTLVIPAVFDFERLHKDFPKEK